MGKFVFSMFGDGNESSLTIGSGAALFLKSSFEDCGWLQEAEVLVNKISTADLTFDEFF